MKLKIEQIISLFEKSLHGMAETLHATSVNVTFDTQNLPNGELITDHGSVSFKVINVLDNEAKTNKLQFIFNDKVTDEFYQVGKNRFTKEIKEKKQLNILSKFENYFFGEI